jgi:hypothetical protein
MLPSLLYLLFSFISHILQKKADEAAILALAQESALIQQLLEICVIKPEDDPGTQIL